MSENKHNQYSSEFKESSVKLAVEAKHPIAQTARDLGINANTLYSWIGKYSTTSMEPPMRTDEHIYDEVKRLKKELARVTEERDLLKKAAAYFAKESR
jgi:transposase